MNTFNKWFSDRCGRGTHGWASKSRLLEEKPYKNEMVMTLFHANRNEYVKTRASLSHSQNIFRPVCTQRT